MAEENQNENGGLQSKKWIIIAAVALIALIGGGAGAYLFMSSSNDDAMASNGDDAYAIPVQDQASYVNIPQPFLYTVPGEDRDRLVQIQVQLMVRGYDNESLAQHHAPLIESTLLSTFSSATQEQLRSSQGRVELRDQATLDVQSTMGKVVGQPVIEKVLFTDFVIQ